MTGYKTVRIVLLVGMVAVMCGTAGAAGMGIIAETHETSVGDYPACPSQCECIAESTAIQRYGENGYEKCSKTVCGQDANAYMQYYCIHPIAGSGVSSSTTMTCQAPCECLAESGALAKWGSNGYTQCSKTSCGRDQTTGGEVPRYCFKQWVSTVNVAAATTASPQSAVTTVLVQQPSLNPPATPTTAAPSYTWPAADATPQKTPLGLVTVLIAVGAALLAVSGMKRE